MKQVIFPPMPPVLRKGAVLIMEITWALFVLLLIALMGLYLCLPQTPMQNAYAEKLARFVLTDIFENADVRFDNLTIARGKLWEPIAIRAHRIRIYPGKMETQTGSPSLQTDNLSLSISPWDLFTGQTLINNVHIERMRLVAQRDEIGRYQFGLAGTRNATHKNMPRSPVKPLAILDRIDNIDIDNATLVFEDLVTKESKTLFTLTLAMRKDLQTHKSVVTATARETTDAPKPFMDFNLTSDAVKKDAEILISLDKFGIDRITPWIPELQHQILSAQGAFSGEIRMRYDKNTAALTDYKIVLNSDKGGVQFLDAPQSLVYDNFALLMTQNGLKFTGNLQGRAITLNTTENISKIGGYTIDLHIPALAIADIAGLMKEGRDSVAQEWLTEKLKNGTMSNINVTGHVHRDKNKEWTMSNLVADLDVDNMWILYKHDLAPADAVTAHAHYEGDKLSLLFEKGSVSGMNIIEGHLDFADLTKAGAGDCKGLLRLKGSLQNVLSYLDNPLIRYKERVAVDLSKATGNVQMSLGLDFPTTKDVAAELIKVDVDAILRNASMPDIINGVTISGGPLALKGNANDILIRGDAMLNGTPSHMTYQTYFDPKTAPFTQKLDLKGSIDATTLAGFGLDSWARDVKSPSKYTISYNQSIGKKPVLNLAISGSDLSVTTASIGLAQNNRFESANLDGLVLGKTRGNMNVIHNKNNGYDIVFNGAMFDARPVLSSSDTKKKKNSPAFLNATINAGSMILSDKGTLDNTKLIYASNARGDVAKLDLSGDIGGNKTVISFNETTRGDTLNVDIANAGAFLSAMDLTQGVKGGSVQINANPNGEYGSMKGDARMTGFTARDVPFLGRIINALSLPGLLQLFTNEGIAFERLSTGFTWSKSDNVSMLRLDNGKTAGSSLGLTFEGAYNHTNKTLDIKGKVVPLSEINNIVKSIPLLGPLISGGKNGALVAASYTMRGPVKDPNVFINPLSILTPGLLRTILFDGATTPPAETNK